MNLPNVFIVTRHNSTKNIKVGRYATLQEAEKAMQEHFTNTPKRGKFYYTISEVEQEEIAGIVYYKMVLVLSGENAPYYKRYSKEELSK